MLDGIDITFVLQGSILDAGFAAQQTAVFEQDLLKAKVVSYDDWLRRPIREKLGERLDHLLGSEL